MQPVKALWLGRRDYGQVWQAMREFTDRRDSDTGDTILALEHDPVFTQGQSGRAEHLLDPGTIPVVASDRGGQVTYHGPGQLVVYPLLDLRRLGLGPRSLVIALEHAMIDCLAEYRIVAAGDRAAPGVYVEGCKIGSIGMRIRRGCCYHGLALNVAMDLEPYSRINPCGFQNLEMTQISEQVSMAQQPLAVANRLLPHLLRRLGIKTGPASLTDASESRLETLLTMD